MAKTATKENPMGLKRICTNCGGRFYDMNKRPIICPTCETEFTGEVKVKSRRGRAAVVEEPKAVKKEAETPVNENEEDILEEDEGVEVVSLDDAEEASNDDDDETILAEDDNLDDIPDLEGEDLDDLGDDDDTLLVEDDEV